MEDGRVLIKYREEAVEYGDLANASSDLRERRALRKLEQTFAMLADNEKWLADNYKNTMHAERDQVVSTALPMSLKR
jgi:hypothetical protein